MQLIPIKTRKLLPPKDDLLGALRISNLSLREGDIIALSSKVVSIGEGRTVPVANIEKEALLKQEATWYWQAPKSSRYRRTFTIAGGALVGSSGIDESNGAGYYVLYPKDPMKSARALRGWLQKTYRIKKLALVITDSTSILLRRGTIGFALAWSGFETLRDYRGSKDLFGRPFVFEVANIADSLATASNLVMGEGDEQTPLVIIRGAKNISFVKTDAKNKKETPAVSPDDDIFAPLFFGKKWKSNKRTP